MENMRVERGALAGGLDVERRLWGHGSSVRVSVSPAMRQARTVRGKQREVEVGLLRRKRSPVESV